LNQTKGSIMVQARECAESTLDMEFPRGIKQYDKIWCKQLMKKVQVTLV